jgi:multidrug efflux pump subunit AcrA (membrane-fusion protein)
VSSSSGFITLSNLSAIVIPASVSESDIGSVKVGDAASITFAALTDTDDPSGTTVAGKVSEVDLTSTVTSSVVDYGVTVTLSTVPATLRLGQSATVTITTASKSNVLRLPSSAITTLGTRKTVTVRNGTSTSVVAVQTGLTGDSTTEITSGLTAGQTVVIPSTTTTSTSSLLGGGAGGGTGSLLGGGR